MRKLISHPAVFVVLYLLFMLPTYILPYLGSNSSLLNAAAAATEGVNPAFWAHLTALAFLVLLAWFRGSAIQKRWLIIFPVLAAVFDMAPMLNMIPLIATVMHLMAIIFGVIVKAEEASVQPA